MAKPAKPAAPRLPIVIASGFSLFPLFLKKDIKRLTKNGCDITLVDFNLNDMVDVDTFAAHIEDVVRQAATRSPTGMVNLIGLSLGGVASLDGLKRRGLAQYVHTFIAGGAPFHGSTFSWVGLPTVLFSRIAKQLSPGSRFLRQLRDEAMPAGVRVVCLAGSKDAICPQATALLPHTEQVVAKFDHTDLFRKHWVHDLLISFCE